MTLRDVHVGFGARAVLDGVDLVVGPRDRVGVVAPNGVGKSTLLRVIAGELAPESGVVVRAPASTTVVPSRSRAGSTGNRAPRRALGPTDRRGGSPACDGLRGRRAGR